MTDEQIKIYNVTRGLRNASRTLSQAAHQELSTYSKKDKKKSTEERRKVCNEWIEQHKQNAPRYNAVLDHLEGIAQGEIDKYIKDNDLTVEGLD